MKGRNAEATQDKAVRRAVWINVAGKTVVEMREVVAVTFAVALAVIAEWADKLAELAAGTKDVATRTVVVTIVAEEKSCAEQALGRRVTIGQSGPSAGTPALRNSTAMKRSGETAGLRSSPTIRQRLGKDAVVEHRVLSGKKIASPSAPTVVPGNSATTKRKLETPVRKPVRIGMKSSRLSRSPAR